MKSIAVSIYPIRARGNFYAASALLLACALLLAGCGSLSKAPRPTIYDFGPGPVAVATNETGTTPGSSALPPIALGEVEAPNALDNLAVLYRLGYANAQQPRPYALARWSMSPAQLVRQRLRERLSQSRPVLNPGEGSASRMLRIELEEFSQLFSAPGTSAGLVRLRATLIDTSSAGEKLVAQRNVLVQRPAAGADAAAGVRALTAATDAAIDEVDQWLRAQR